MLASFCCVDTRSASKRLDTSKRTGVRRFYVYIHDYTPIALDSARPPTVDKRLRMAGNKMGKNPPYWLSLCFTPDNDFNLEVLARSRIVLRWGYNFFWV